MPELPEVETIRRQLNQKLVGKCIKTIDAINLKSFSGDVTLLRGKKIKAVNRKSKLLFFEFEDTNWCVVSHLKMTGQYVFVENNQRIVGGHPTSDWVDKLPSKHTRIIWNFEDEAILFFNDVRMFGWQKLVSQNEMHQLIESLPHDVVDVAFDTNYFAEAMGKTGRAIKLALTDQTLLGGVGNIYANDALFDAKINPWKKARDLSTDELTRLHLSIVKVVSTGVEKGGASINDYVNALGEGGGYQDVCLVYGRDGQQCLNCKKMIMKTKIGGRSCFYCPSCQD